MRLLFDEARATAYGVANLFRHVDSEVVLRRPGESEAD
jgi:hypothetical protein